MGGSYAAPSDYRAGTLYVATDNVRLVKLAHDLVVRGSRGQFHSFESMRGPPHSRPSRAAGFGRFCEKGTTAVMPLTLKVSKPTWRTVLRLDAVDPQETLTDSKSLPQSRRPVLPPPLTNAASLQHRRKCLTRRQCFANIHVLLHPPSSGRRTLVAADDPVLWASGLWFMRLTFATRREAQFVEGRSVWWSANDRHEGVQHVFQSEHR